MGPNGLLIACCPCGNDHNRLIIGTGKDRDPGADCTILSLATRALFPPNIWNRKLAVVIQDKAVVTLLQ